jgi:hypothetical protein
MEVAIRIIQVIHHGDEIELYLVGGDLEAQVELWE